MKNLFFLSFVFPTLLFAGFGASWASNTTDEAEEEVPASNLENLSNQLKQLSQYARVRLLLQTQYVTSGEQVDLAKGFKTPTNGASYNDLFLGRRAEVSFYGDLDDKKVSYCVQYDFLGSTIAKPGVAAGQQLKDGWIRFSYIPCADIQVGQQRYAQGLEARTSSADLDFIDSALVTSAVEDRRDLTVQVSSSLIPLGQVKLEYAAALVQGSGQNTADNNNNKDFAGRIGLTYGQADWKIFVGASGYDGWENTVAAHPGDRNGFDLEGRVNLGGLKLQGEYIHAQLEPGNNYNPFGTVNSHPQGWYASADYRAGDWRPGIRVESYNEDVTRGSTVNFNHDVLTAGLDWFRGKDRIRLTANFEEHFGQYEALIGQAQVNI